MNERKTIVTINLVSEARAKEYAVATKCMKAFTDSNSDKFKGIVKPSEEINRHRDVVLFTLDPVRDIDTIKRRYFYTTHRVNCHTWVAVPVDEKTYKYNFVDIDYINKLQNDKSDSLVAYISNTISDERRIETATWCRELLKIAPEFKVIRWTNPRDIEMLIDTLNGRHAELGYDMYSAGHLQCVEKDHVFNPAIGSKLYNGGVAYVHTEDRLKWDYVADRLLDAVRNYVQIEWYLKLELPEDRPSEDDMFAEELVDVNPDWF